MGNNTSTETARRPHKLSKPRVGDHTSTAGFSSGDGRADSQYGRFSNSYLVGPVPVSPTEAPLTDPFPNNIGLAVLDEKLEIESFSASTSSPRDSLCRNGATCSKSSRDGEKGGSISVQTVRPRAINDQAGDVSPSQGSFTQLSRIESTRISIRSSKSRRTVDSDVSASMTQHQTVNRGHVQEKSLARSGSFAATHGVTESTWKTSHPHPESTASLSRTNSEASLYIPVRRRSVMQTPGIATRPQYTNPKVPTKSSYRNSVPSTPSLSRRTSIESVQPRRMSLPAVHVDLTSQLRVATPSEAEYKQLGGMKFGTLRITNGAPELTPRPEVEEGIGRSQTSASQSSTPGYFDKVERVHAAPSLNLKERDEDCLQMTSKNRERRKLSLGNEGQTMRTPRQPTQTPLQIPTTSRQQNAGVPSKILSVEPSYSSTPSRTTSKSSTSDGQNRKQTGKRLESFAVHKSDTRGSTTTMMKPERLRLELEHKVVRTLSKSDSGFVPSPSSETSRKGLSKSDSGYSSNLSLQSLQTSKSGISEKSQKPATGLGSGVVRSKSWGNPKIPEVPRETRTNLHHRSKSELPRRPPSPPTHEPSPPVPVRRSSLSSLARGAIRRLPTLRTSRSRDCSSVREIAAPGHVDAVDDVKSESSNWTSQSANNESGKRQEFSEGDPRIALSKQYMHSSGPSFQTRVVDEKDTHKAPRKRSNSASHRYSPRNRSSKDTLRTILSVGSTDMLQTYESSEVDSQQEPVDEKASEPSTPRRRSLHSVSHSFAQRTASLLHSKKSSDKKTTHVGSPKRDAGSEITRGPGARSSNMNGVGECTGKSAVIQNHAALPAEKLDCRRTSAKANSMGSRSHKHISPLKTQRSAPNVTRQGEWPLSPSYPEFSHLQKSKTPPPVSMRTRSSKNLRPAAQGRSWSAPPTQMPTVPRFSFPNQTSQESINSYRSSQASMPSPRTPASPTMNSPTRTRQHNSPRADVEKRSKSQSNMQGSPRRKSYAPGQELLRSSRTMHPGAPVPYTNFSHPPPRLPIHQRPRSTGQPASPSHPSKRSPQAPLQEVSNVNRQHQRSHHASTKTVQSHSRHGSSSSAGSQFRVLHSYDSPAYRGVPIWG